MACSVFLLDSVALDTTVDNGINHASKIDYTSSAHDFLDT